MIGKTDHQMFGLTFSNLSSAYYSCLQQCKQDVYQKVGEKFPTIDESTKWTKKLVEISLHPTNQSRPNLGNRAK